MDRGAAAAGGATAMPDPAGATFAVEGEDHALANALRFFLNKDPRVSFAGYSMPHPTEEVVNVRVQTTGELSAIGSGCLDFVCLRFWAVAAPPPPPPPPRPPGATERAPVFPTPSRLSLSPQMKRPTGQISATEALQSSCTELQRVCDHVLAVFDRAVEEHQAAAAAAGSGDAAEAAAAPVPPPSSGKRPSSSSKKR